jgi:GDP-L-fucose synthase
MNESAKIFVADHQGMVGAAIARELIEQGHPARNIVTRSASKLPLKHQSAVLAFFARESIDQIYLPVAHPTGVAREQHPADILLSLSHVIHAASVHRVPKLVLIGSPHIYPQMAMSPLAEEELLTGRLDPTSENLGLAQITAIHLCNQLSRAHQSTGGQAPALDYRCLITPTPYGPGDDYITLQSDTVAGMLGRLHLAKMAGERRVSLPTNGATWHEYLYVSEAARAAIYLMNVAHGAYQQQTRHGVGHINAGDSKDYSLSALAQTIAEVIRYNGVIDMPLPNYETGPRRRLDSYRMRMLGWRPALCMQEGLALAYDDYLAHHTAAASAAGLAPVLCRS